MKGNFEIVFLASPGAIEARKGRERGEGGRKKGFSPNSTPTFNNATGQSKRKEEGKGGGERENGCP